MNPDRVLLEARGIGRLAPGKPNWLLREVSFTVRGGERLAIVGATGSLARSWRSWTLSTKGRSFGAAITMTVIAGIS